MSEIKIYWTRLRVGQILQGGGRVINLTPTDAAIQNETQSEGIKKNLQNGQRIPELWGYSK